MPQYAGSYHVHGMHMAADAGSPVPYQRDRERSARPTAPNTTTRDQIKHSGRYLGLDSRSHWYTRLLAYRTTPLDLPTSEPKKMRRFTPSMCAIAHWS